MQVFSFSKCLCSEDGLWSSYAVWNNEFVLFLCMWDLEEETCWLHRRAARILANWSYGIR